MILNNIDFPKKIPESISGFSIDLADDINNILSHVYQVNTILIDCSEDTNIENVKITLNERFDVGILDKFSYSRVSRVWNKGEYSVLGDIVTIWPNYMNNPIRLDMFDSIVERIDIVSHDTRVRISSLKTYILYNLLNRKIFVKNLDDSSFSLIKYVYDGEFVFEVRKLPAINHLLSTNSLNSTLNSYINQGYKIYVDTKDNIKLPDELNIYQKIVLGINHSIIHIHTKTIILSLYDLIHDVYDDTEISFKKGDYVVHHDHGIGLFMGIVINNDIKYLDIRYAQDDRLLVPISYINKVDRYIGSGKSKPKVTKLNSGSWGRTISAVKQKVGGIAKELLKLYSLRQITKLEINNDFDELRNKYWEFAESFKYKDTDDQKLISQTILDDLKKDIPMDRLIVGDVGFGKTELAVRAAYAVVKSGGQVAVLAPTTILASQHLRVFSDRMSQFGINVGMLSRLNTSDQNRDIIDGIELGLYDVVIGTHRVLQNDVKFKNLKLLIIDEEQRFGVIHKEKLKEKRLDVHVLSMSATPIPRTMSMAISGIRDLSILASVPEGRKPIINSFNKFDWNLVIQNIKDELNRDGQVYYLHNRVADILNIKMELEIKIPGIRVSVIHGKLSKIEIARQMQLFINRQSDILLCTTIIENGLDLENVNTLIVDDASVYGLSQLYQIRGRVGRSPIQAYAHFYYNSLKGDLIQRLDALNEAHDLGAGFILASRDLEIRGAGNILGKEQSGSINSVGYSLYIKMISEVVENLRKNNV